jgi:hypothetical protein
LPNRIYGVRVDWLPATTWRTAGGVALEELKLHAAVPKLLAVIAAKPFLVL